MSESYFGGALPGLSLHPQMMRQAHLASSVPPRPGDDERGAGTSAVNGVSPAEPSALAARLESLRPPPRPDPTRPTGPPPAFAANILDGLPDSLTPRETGGSEIDNGPAASLAKLPGGNADGAPGRWAGYDWNLGAETTMPDAIGAADG